MSLERIRADAKKRAESQEVGGVREWFDIAFLLKEIDKRDKMLEALEDGKYEYNVVRVSELTKAKRVFYHTWATEEEMIDMWSVGTLEEVKKAMPQNWTLVKRRMPEGYENA